MRGCVMGFVGLWVLGFGAGCASPTCPAGTELEGGACVVPVEAPVEPEPLSCPAETADCDGDVGNGCEVTLRDNPSHCGACGRSCAWACGGLACNDPVQVVSGSEHNCLLRADGSVWCWGSNEWGAHRGVLGDGTTVLQRPLPVRTLGSDGLPLTGVTKLASGTGHVCAIKEDTSLHCWGNNELGRLGIGNNNAQTQATAVAGIDASDLQLTGVVDVALGFAHSCAALEGGAVACWGSDGWDTLGFGTLGVEEHRDRPMVATWVNDAVRPLGPVVAMASGGHSSTCVVTEQGRGVCWGASDQNQLGHGHFWTTSGLAPDEVTEVGDRFSAAAGLVDVAAGGWYGCALKNNGQVMCWGDASLGRVGNGLDTQLVPLSGPSPIGYQVAQWVVQPGFGEGGPPLAGVRSLAEGEWVHLCAGLEDGRAVCWGANSHGQIGDGDAGFVVPGSVEILDAKRTATPKYVVGLEGAEFLRGVKALSVGGQHSCALLEDGRVACWGSNRRGQLGDGSTEDSSRPVLVQLPGAG